MQALKLTMMLQTGWRQKAGPPDSKAGRHHLLSDSSSVSTVSRSVVAGVAPRVVRSGAVSTSARAARAASPPCTPPALAVAAGHLLRDGAGTFPPHDSLLLSQQRMLRHSTVSCMICRKGCSTRMRVLAVC